MVHWRTSFFVLAALLAPTHTYAQALAPTDQAPAAESSAGLVSSLFGQKKDLKLKDAINYEACFDYSEKMSITFSHKCLFSKFPPVPAPVFRYKAKHTEPTAIVELTLEPGGGALQTSASVGSLVGQGSLTSLAGAVLGGGVGTKTYVGNTNPNMPTLGRIPSVYFDGHIWGVGPLGLLDAGKGGEEKQGGGRMNALKSMICWLADASDFWAPIPFKASAHLAIISPAAEAYVRYFLGDWGNRWYNKAGSAQVSATTATSFVSGFADSSAFSLAALGALVGHALASGSDDDKCSAQAATHQARQQAAQTKAAAVQSQPKLETLAPRATYLPAGYDQVNVGYDTCPLTGTGYYVDEDTGNVAFSNCDPQERIIQLDCSTGLGRIVDNAPGNVTATMNPYEDPCQSGIGQQFQFDPYTYVRAPACKQRLSGFQEKGRYLACNDQSRTYASCGLRLTGTGRLKDGHSAGETGTQEGAFELCLRPQGQKTIDHLSEHNTYLSQNTLQTAEAYERGVIAAADTLERNISQNQIQCKSGGGGSGIGGAAVGAAVGFGVSKGLKFFKDSAKGDGGEGGSPIPGSSAVGDAIKDVKEGFDEVSNNIKTAIQDSELVKGFNSATMYVSEQFKGIKVSVTGKLSDFTEDAGLGSLSSVTSKAGALLAFNGSLSSITNLAERFNIIPDWLNSAVSAFNQDKIIPLYLSEQNIEDWRDENPASKAARITAFQNVPLAPNVSLFGKNLAGFNCGEVGGWGQLCPLRGFVETSGNKFPASGLAGWRAYHKALPKIPDRKRMKGKPTQFNLDYPHQTACFDIGEDPDKWESRRENSGGILSKIFSASGSGLASIFQVSAGASVSGGLVSGLGSLFGPVADKRAETGVFVYTYWKNTKCSWDVCTSPFSGFGLSDLANIPGLDALKGVAGRINDLKNNLPGAAILKNSATVKALKDLPGSGFVGGVIKDKALGTIPGGNAVAGVIGGIAGFAGGSSDGGTSSGGSGGGCVGPLLNCGNTPSADSGTPSPVVPDYLGGGAAIAGATPKTLNGAFGALESLPGAEALTSLISSLPPISLPKLGNLGKILKFKSEE